MVSGKQNRQYSTLHFADYLTGGNAGAKQYWLEPGPSSRPLVKPAVGRRIPPRTSWKANGSRPYFTAAMSRICMDLLSVGVDGVEFPGGLYRSSCRLLLSDGRSVIATKRNDA